MQNNDPQTIWQQQKQQEINVSLAPFFKLKAEQQRTRNRWIVAANDFVYLATISFLGFLFVKTTNLTERVGLALLAGGSLFVIYQMHKQLWPPPVASEAPPDTGLEAYRRELMRWQTNQRNLWRTLAPLLPGAIVVAASGIRAVIRAASTNPAILINGAPFCVLLAVWLVALPVVRKRRLKKVQQELEALGS